MDHGRHQRPAAARGFTLMEMLVVLGIFSTVVISATDIFMMSSRSQRKVVALERAQADARFTMETISRVVRTGQIDYAEMDLSASGPVEALALIDSLGRKIRFFSSTENCADPVSSPCLRLAVDGGEPVTATPQGVILRNLRFYVMPDVDPSVFNSVSGRFEADVQPHVTVVLVLESAGQDPRERSIVYLQTTTESRGYGR
ncbi:MAG: type II secretion system protein [Patescibacteria group bacterium]|jgi:prepilin-type N-terminal cleavage/methylation domain-containing protein